MKTPNLIIILTCVLFLTLIKIQSCNHLKDLQDLNSIHVKAMKDTVSNYTDKFNQLHKQVELSDKDAYNIRLAYKDLLAKKGKELNVVPKRISGMTTIVLEKKINLDSLIKAHTRVIQLPGDTTWHVLTDSIPVFVYDSLSITQYSKREGWLGLKRKMMIDVINYADNNSVKRIEGFQIKNKPTNLNFGPIGGVSWDGTKFIPIIGIGVQWRWAGIRIGKR